MAERLPVGMGRNGKLPSVTSFSTGLSDTASVAMDQMDIPSSIFPESDSNASRFQVPNGSSSTENKNRLDYSESTRNGTKNVDDDPNPTTEWVEQDEPGVYITLISLPGGAKDLKRVRFRYV